jgi:hypothetical protein
MEDCEERRRHRCNWNTLRHEGTFEEELYLSFDNFVVQIQLLVLQHQMYGVQVWSPKGETITLLNLAVFQRA